LSILIFKTHIVRTLIPFLVLIMFASCGEKGSTDKTQSENILENLSFTIDTVMIDPKGKLFELNWGPRSSSISEDGKHLFLFNSNSNQIQQINLDALVWEKDFDFEVEGPNGISDAVFSTQTLGGEKFLITAYRKLGVFDQSGRIIKDFAICALPISSDLEELDYGIVLSKDQKSIFSLPGIRFHGPRTFAKIDLETFEIANFPIPEMDWIFDLKVGGSTHYLLDEYMYLKELNKQILALTPSTSAFYRYDLERGSLHYHSFVHEFSPEANDVKLKNTVETDEEYQEELKKFFMSFTFGPPIWDENRQVFFRFGRKPIFMAEAFQIGESQVFMYVYDPEFKLIGEALLPDISRVPSSPFFKDGKLWSYVNVEDELGFAVFTFDF